MNLFRHCAVFFDSKLLQQSSITQIPFVFSTFLFFSKFEVETIYLYSFSIQKIQLLLSYITFFFAIIIIRNN